MSTLDNREPEDINKEPERSSFGNIIKLLSCQNENPRSLDSIIISEKCIILLSILSEFPDAN